MSTLTWGTIYTRKHGKYSKGIHKVIAINMNEYSKVVDISHTNINVLL